MQGVLLDRSTGSPIHEAADKHMRRGGRQDPHPLSTIDNYWTKTNSPISSYTFGRHVLTLSLVASLATRRRHLNGSVVVLLQMEKRKVLKFQSILGFPTVFLKLVSPSARVTKVL